jgi:hypothetical protein
MPTYSRRNLVIGTQGPFSVIWPKVTNAQTLIWDASLGSFVSPVLQDQETVSGFNLGNGLNVFENQVGTQLQFNTFSGEGGIVLSKIGNEIVIRGGTTVVADLGARDSLIPDLVVGQQVFVTDTGQGEYALYLWSGSGFVLLSSFDSSQTDAQTFQQVINFDTPKTVLARISPSRRISNIVVEVLTLFDDNNASISIGDDVNGSQIHMPNDLVNLFEFDNYQTSSTFVYPGPDEIEVFAYLDAGTSTQGQVRVTITYV